MKNSNQKKNNDIKVGNLPFEKIVGGFLEVEPPDKKKRKKNNKAEGKD